MSDQQSVNESVRFHDGEVALVTGGARRIGAALARGFHAAGARVVIHYHRSHDAARALASELEDLRPRSVQLVRRQLGSQHAAHQLTMDVIRAHGRLDILINNASTFAPTPLESLVESDVQNLLTSNFLAPLYLCQAATPYLRQHHGCIANIIDIQALRVLPDYSVYCAAKAALRTLTQCLAVELAPTVRVNGVAPGTILWPEGAAELDEEARARIVERIPLGEIGTPRAVADAALYLCSPAARYVTGQILDVDGGRSLG